MTPPRRSRPRFGPEETKQVSPAPRRRRPLMSASKRPPRRRGAFARIRPSAPPPSRCAVRVRPVFAFPICRNLRVSGSRGLGLWTRPLSHGSPSYAPRRIDGLKALPSVDGLVLVQFGEIHFVTDVPTVNPLFSSEVLEHAISHGPGGAGARNPRAA